MNFSLYQIKVEKFGGLEIVSCSMLFISNYVCLHVCLFNSVCENNILDKNQLQHFEV